jgi:hypothetical protein
MSDTLSKSFADLNKKRSNSSMSELSRDNSPNKSKSPFIRENAPNAYKTSDSCYENTSRHKYSVSMKDMIRSRSK